MSASRDIVEQEMPLDVSHALSLLVNAARIDPVLMDAARKVDRYVHDLRTEHGELHHALAALVEFFFVGCADHINSGLTVNGEMKVYVAGEKGYLSQRASNTVYPFLALVQPGGQSGRKPEPPPLCPTCNDVHWGADDFEYACKDPFHQTGRTESGRGQS